MTEPASPHMIIGHCVARLQRRAANGRVGANDPVIVVIKAALPLVNGPTEPDTCEPERTGTARQEVVPPDTVQWM
jgi:hypothetical protein